jgi:tetrapyrrole methylase family protein/MazG family protein
MNAMRDGDNKAASAETTEEGAGAPAKRSSVGETAQAFGRLYSIIAKLRAPEGCPWDREQTPKSLRGNIIEETYELVEAIDEGDAPHVREEAGDLYLLATMVAYMHEEMGSFSVADTLDAISAKLVRRHPHVFADSEAATPDAVIRQWNEIKEKVEGKRRKDSILDEVSRALPPLERSYKVQKKAAKAGFDWTRASDVWAKAREELAEAEQICTALAAGDGSAAGARERAAAGGDRSGLEDELGDLLFSAVNLSRFLGVDPGLALNGAIEKFSRRFRHVEKRMAEAGKPLAAENMDLMDSFWNEAKAHEE